jgi:hypothetical protein
MSNRRAFAHRRLRAGVRHRPVPADRACPVAFQSADLCASGRLVPCFGERMLKLTHRSIAAAGRCVLAPWRPPKLWIIAKFTGIVGETGARLDHPWAGAVIMHVVVAACPLFGDPRPRWAAFSFAWHCPARIRPTKAASVRCWAPQTARGDEGLRQDAITSFSILYLDTNERVKADVLTRIQTTPDRRDVGATAKLDRFYCSPGGP